MALCMAQGYKLHYFMSGNHHNCDLVGSLIKSKMWREGDEMGIFVDYCMLEEPAH
jgi:hypothetical protein